MPGGGQGDCCGERTASDDDGDEDYETQEEIEEEGEGSEDGDGNSGDVDEDEPWQQRERVHRKGAEGRRELEEGHEPGEAHPGLDLGGDGEEDGDDGNADADDDNELGNVESGVSADAPKVVQCGVDSQK